MAAIVHYRKKLRWLLGIVIVIWAAHFVYKIVSSWKAVAILCTEQVVGLTEDELASRARQPGLRYTRFPNSENAIIIADLTPDGPDCRIVLSNEKVKSFIYDGNGYSP